MNEVSVQVNTAAPGTVHAWRNPPPPAGTRAEWMKGPWDAEPSKVQWVDRQTGLPCLIVRNQCGALCGYAGVLPGHPKYGADYDAVDVEVHGGLTYADKCQPVKTHSEGVCHIPEPGTSDDVWWFGFDCSHFLDLVPALRRYIPDIGPMKDKYRDLAYVQREVTRLAQQLAAMA